MLVVRMIGKEMFIPGTVKRPVLPHGVEQRPVILQPQQLVRCGHIVCDGFLPVEEEGVRSPDVTGQEIIQGKHLHRAFKAKSFVFPALTEENVNSVFLQEKRSNVIKGKGLQRFVYVEPCFKKKRTHVHEYNQYIAVIYHKRSDHHFLF